MFPPSLPARSSHHLPPHLGERTQYGMGSVQGTTSSQCYARLSVQWLLGAFVANPLAGGPRSSISQKLSKEAAKNPRWSEEFKRKVAPKLLSLSQAIPLPSSAPAPVLPVNEKEHELEANEEWLGCDVCDKWHVVKTEVFKKWHKRKFCCQDLGSRCSRRRLNYMSSNRYSE